eukprot:gene8315-139_t
MSNLFDYSDDYSSDSDEGMGLFDTPKSVVEEKKQTFEKKEVEKKDFTLKVNNTAKLAEHLSKYFNSGKYSDVSFEIDSKKIMAHKFILATRSKTFSDMFSDGKSSYTIPKISYQTFHDSLQFAYTGQIEIDQNNVDDIIVCSDRYGITALKVFCFEYRIKSVDKDTVIPTIMKGKRKEFEYDASELIDLCFKYLEKNTHEVVKSKTFSQLDEDGVITLCKSGELVIGEVDLFDGVLKWGNVAAKTDNSTLDNVLKNILPLIRFPMMDADYLEKTVKPLNLISKDDLKEAIHFQKHPENYTKSKSEKFKPRGSLFIGGTLISPADGLKLDSYLDKGRKGKIWKCIYKATKDGFSSQNFHKHCDKKGASITVVKSTNGNIFGGFCPLEWNSSGNYQYNKDSWMFSLINSKKKFLQFPQMNNNGNYSIYCYSSYGPTFGGGHDLYIVSNSNSTTGSYSNFGYNFDTKNIGMAYGSSQVQSFLAGSYNFQTSEIEVYSQN